MSEARKTRFTVRADHQTHALVRYPETGETIVGGLSFEVARNAARTLNELFAARESESPSSRENEKAIASAVTNIINVCYWDRKKADEREGYDPLTPRERVTEIICNLLAARQQPAQKPRIKNLKMLAAIHSAVIEHSGNGLLADEIVEFLKGNPQPAQKPQEWSVEEIAGGNVLKDGDGRILARCVHDTRLREFQQIRDSHNASTQTRCAAAPATHEFSEALVDKLLNFLWEKWRFGNPKSKAELRALIDTEFQNLCHDISPVDIMAFCRGCEIYQIKLFGKSPIATMRETLEFIAFNVPNTPWGKAAEAALIGAKGGYGG
jgi:hypothetical protein